MVRIQRRPTRGGNKYVTYGKYAFFGGVLFALAHLLLGGETSHGGHEILQLGNMDSNMKLDPPRNPNNNRKSSLNNKPASSSISHRTIDGGKLTGDSNEDEEHPDDNSDHNPGQKIQYVSPNGEVLEKPEGTGPTKLGYVFDLVYERSHPTFRTESIQRIESSRQDHAQEVVNALSLAGTLQPCEYLEDLHTPEHTPRLLQQKKCRGSTATLYVYNGAPFPRTWCGVSIPPHSAAQAPTGTCNQPVKLLEQDFPPVNGEGMSPVVVHSHADGKVSEDRLQDVEQCSVPCRVEQGMTGIDRFIKGTDWNIFQSDQDPNSKREIQVELSKYKHDEYFSTAYFKSDVPLSRFDFAKHSLRNRPPVKFDNVMDKGVYIVSEQCGATNSRRTRWLETLETQYHVDSLGTCKHTKDVDPGETIDTLEGRIEVMKKYKFNLGFEISTHKDWATELSYEAFLSGAVPIILGASNAAGKHFPREGAIFTQDFNNWDKLAAHVNEVATNKEVWESYHKWRTDETILAQLERKYQFTKIHPDCRLCSWAYAKMYGLGWNHELQIVQENHVPRKLCVDEDTGLIASPFREIWASAAESSALGPSTDACSTPSQSAIDQKTTVEKDDWSVTKSVVQHDSVTDIVIHQVSTSDELTLTLAFEDVNNTEAAFFKNSHTLVATERGMFMSSATVQDHKSKITILANWETNVWSPKQGVLKVMVQAKNAPEIHEDEVRRIRIITEDMGQLHDKMTEYFPSSFSKRMIKDFVDPLEVFHLDS